MRLGIEIQKGNLGSALVQHNVNGWLQMFSIELIHGYFELNSSAFLGQHALDVQVKVGYGIFKHRLKLGQLLTHGQWRIVIQCKECVNLGDYHPIAM